MNHSLSSHKILPRLYFFSFKKKEICFYMYNFNFLPPFVNIYCVKWCSILFCPPVNKLK